MTTCGRRWRGVRPTRRVPRRKSDRDFDFDGTLVDTMRELVDALVDTFGDYLQGDERRRREQMMDVLQLPSRQLFQALVDLTGLPPAQIHSIFAPSCGGLTYAPVSGSPGCTRLFEAVRLRGSDLQQQRG